MLLFPDRSGLTPRVGGDSAFDVDMAAVEHPIRFRALAGILAAGGVFLSFMSAGASMISHSMLVSLVFVPGYIITFGYIIRCVCTPRISWRRIIWGASAFVQGAWIVGIISAITYNELRYGGVTAGDVFGLVLEWEWWLFALCIPIYGFRFDKREAA